MTRREAVSGASVGVLAVAGGVLLLWSAWRVLIAPLPTTAAAAAWTLWVLAVAALVTFVLYVREMARHGLGAGRASWKPLPGLVLLWLGGLTALVAFGFVLPERSGESAQASVDNATTSQTSTATARTSPTGTPTSAATAGQTRSSVAPVKATTQPQPVSTSSSAAPTPTRTAASSPSSTTTSPTPTTSTTEPLLDIVLPPGRGHSKPPHTR